MVAATNPTGSGRVLGDVECPYVDRYDARCAEHLTVSGMAYAYERCFGEYRRCPSYRELTAEAGGIGLTVHGRTIEAGGREVAA
jgi:hypothetical protein